MDVPERCIHEEIMRTGLGVAPSLDRGNRLGHHGWAGRERTVIRGRHAPRRWRTARSTFPEILPTGYAMNDWPESLDAAVTVTDRDLTVIYMNEKARTSFAKWGGENFLGKNLADCHMPHSMEIIHTILATGKPNVYTIEKQGVKKLIYQAVWKTEGKVAGLVEISMVLPEDMPHHIRT
jgi:hypothetical protein